MSFCSRLLRFIIFASFNFAWAFHSDATPSENYTTNTPWVGEPGIHRRTADISRQASRGRHAGRIQFVGKLADAEFPESPDTPVLPVPAIDGGPSAFAGAT